LINISTPRWFNIQIVPEGGTKLIRYSGKRIEVIF